ncbi:MAG: PIG-L deacetylase family protein [Acidithiobacillales bacterium]
MTAFIPEEKLIPYEASTFSARRVLVLAPHPDDEVFGCGCALADLRARGADLLVCILTDGAGGEPDPEVRRRIADLRLKESGAALALLGGGRLLKGSFRDRGLADAGPALAEKLEAFLSEAGADLVFCPSPVEIHPDHRAAASALITLGVRAPAGSETARLLAGATIAFYELSQPIRPNFLFDCGPHWETKRKAMTAFASQNAERDYAGFVSGLNAYRRMTLPKGTTAAEGYFVVPGTGLARGAAALSAEMSPLAGESPEAQRPSTGRKLRDLFARSSR